MYLSKLEIQGFKSFANRTVVNFTKGITGIVGPNGCGKTNIVDAIRWALGEQKSKTLRSDKMENVIFNGTKNKKPMGMAEVSLTIVNDDGVLPTEYSEVTITRRIFRSGESEYLLNRQICRLKDITNLFMDTGMSTNAYSVIELKMVENILSSRNDERRTLFEEAAGVNKYKLRRRLALKRLEEVKSDLTRVNDIVAEVEKKVRALERQAKKADKYNQINMVLKEKELDLAEREFSFFTSKKIENEKNAELLKERKEQIDFDIREIEKELIFYRDQISEIESKLKVKRAEISKITEKLHNVQKNISVAEERKRSFHDNISRFKKELEELKIQLTETEDAIEINKDIIVELEESIAEQASQIDGSDEIIAGKEKIVEQLKEELKAQNNLVLSKIKEIDASENKLNSNKKNLSKLEKEIISLQGKIDKNKSDIETSDEKLLELNKEREELEIKVSSQEELLNNEQLRKENLENKIKKLRDDELEEKNILNNLENKIEFLRTLISNLEGISKASKSLIENSDWSDAEKTVFADVGNTDEKYRFALEAALKQVLNNLLIEDFNNLKKGISFLKENDLGKASFFLLKQPEYKKTFLDKISDYNLKRKIKKLEAEPKFKGWTKELVQTQSKWKPYFDKVLNKTCLVDNLDDALYLHQLYPEFNYTTIDGDFLNAYGIVEAGSQPKLEETLFGRKQELEKLEKEPDKLKRNIEKLQELIKETEEELASIDIKKISEELKGFISELNNLEKKISQIDFENNRIKESLQEENEQLQQLLKEQNELNAIVEEAEEIISNFSAEKEELEKSLLEIETKLKVAEEDYSNSKEEITQKKLEYERLLGKKQNTINAIKRLEESIVVIKNNIEKREKDIEQSEEELSAITTIIDDNQIEYDAIFEDRQELIEQEVEIDEELKSIRNEASKFEKEVNALRKERQEISDKLHTVDLNNNRIDLKLENLVSNIKEDYSIELEFKEYDDLENFNFEERNREVSKLKSELKNLGPINLLAYSEYEEEHERLEFLNKQRTDLIESEKDLVKTIHEINDTAQTLFKETFELIRANFKKIFQTLFNPGDEADLILQEGVDPLEAKIDIVAKPKGKRPTGIELLSGGEKTLTATALLFAIYLVKPSPFCILDEVDAPLDDANVARYTRLIKDFSKNTQFIMVTHNKRTMEAAENMYGVTMQEEGISKLVGVQFNEDIKATA